MPRILPNGYEPASGAAERRAQYDLMRRIATLVDEVDALQSQAAALQWEAVGRTTGGSSTTTSTSYVDWPATPLVVNFTKVRGDTAIIVDIGASAFAAAPAGAADWGVRIGSTDYDVIDAFYNDLSVHAGWNNTVRITGLAAGAHTATLRLKTGGGSINSDINDTLSMAIRERF